MLGIVENLAVDVFLGTSFIDRCVCSTFPIARMVSLIQSHSIAKHPPLEEGGVLPLQDIQNDPAPQLWKPKDIFVSRSLLWKVHGNTQCLNTVTSPPTRHLLTKFCSDGVLKHELTIGLEMMGFFSGPSASLLRTKPLNCTWTIYRTNNQGICV